MPEPRSCHQLQHCSKTIMETQVILQVEAWYGRAKAFACFWVYVLIAANNLLHICITQSQQSKSSFMVRPLLVLHTVTVRNHSPIYNIILNSVRPSMLYWVVKSILYLDLVSFRVVVKGVWREGVIEWREKQRGER